MRFWTRRDDRGGVVFVFTTEGAPAAFEMEAEVDLDVMPPALV
jgi:hypothetical protein